MKIDIADKDHIWIDGVQFVSLNRMNQIVQEKGTIDYDRIQSIVENNVKSILAATNGTISAYLGVPKFTDDQFEEYCKTRNLCVVGAETLSQRYNEGYDKALTEAIPIKWLTDYADDLKEKKSRAFQFAGDFIHALIKDYRADKSDGCGFAD